VSKLSKVGKYELDGEDYSVSFGDAICGCAYFKYEMKNFIVSIVLRQIYLMASAILSKQHKVALMSSFNKSRTIFTFQGT